MLMACARYQINNPNIFSKARQKYEIDWHLKWRYQEKEKNKLKKYARSNKIQIKPISNKTLLIINLKIKTEPQ